jgi:hypothetical protein
VSYCLLLAAVEGRDPFRSVPLGPRNVQYSPFTLSSRPRPHPSPNTRSNRKALIGHVLPLTVSLVSRMASPSPSPSPPVFRPSASPGLSSSAALLSSLPAQSPWALVVSSHPRLSVITTPTFVVRSRLESSAHATARWNARYMPCSALLAWTRRCPAR